MATNPKLKAMSDAAAAKWMAKNPGKTRADYTAYAKQSTAARTAAYKATGGASKAKSPKPAARPVPPRVNTAYESYLAKNPGATRADFHTYTVQRIKEADAKGKARLDASFAKWQAKNPGGTRDDWHSALMQKLRNSTAKAKARKTANTNSGVTARTTSASPSADAGYARYAAKNPGATRSDYSAYAKQRVKDMAEQGFQRYAAKNPGATRSDYSAYAKQRVKDFAARSRSRKLSG